MKTVILFAGLAMVLAMCLFWWKRRQTHKLKRPAPVFKPEPKPKSKPDPHVAVLFTTRERGIDTEWQHLMDTEQSQELTLLAVLDSNEEVFGRYGIEKDACPVVLLLDPHGKIVSSNEHGMSYREQLKGLI